MFLFYKRNYHFSLEKRSPPSQLVVEFLLEKNTFRKKQISTQKKLQQQRNPLETVEDFASEAKTSEIFRDFVFSSFFNIFLISLQISESSIFSFFISSLIFLYFSIFSFSVCCSFFHFSYFSFFSCLFFSAFFFPPFVHFLFFDVCFVVSFFYSFHKLFFYYLNFVLSFFQFVLFSFFFFFWVLRIRFFLASTASRFLRTFLQKNMFLSRLGGNPAFAASFPFFHVFHFFFFFIVPIFDFLFGKSVSSFFHFFYVYAASSIFNRVQQKMFPQ